MGRNKKSEKDVEIVPVTIGGEKYLTFPQTQIFTGLGREVLRQRMSRKKLPFKLIEPYYIFIPYDVCVQLKEGEVKDKETHKLKDLFTVEEIQELIRLKTNNSPISNLVEVLDKNPNLKLPRKK
jgi:hypothetical protein